MTQLLRFPEYSYPSAEPDQSPRPQKMAVVNFVDSKDEYLWGVYSIHKQMEKFNMTPSVAHVALVASDIKKERKALLQQWLGPENVREVDKSFIRDLVPKKQNLWIPVFYKMETFNMTDFDKLIVLDNDIFIRKNILHWFDYPAPAATQARGTIEWNSGAMVIEPSARLYKALIDKIPLTRAWNPGQDDGDNWNSKDGQQGFLSSFFLSNVTHDTMFTMSYGASMLSTDLEKMKENHYFWKYRPDAIETIHFTQHKPWKAVTSTSHPAVCAMMREWLESVSDAPKGLPPLPDILRKCPPPSVNADDGRPSQAAREVTITIG
jgi:alpha-N-acetylglucosamine transferase